MGCWSPTAYSRPFSRGRRDDARDGPAEAPTSSSELDLRGRVALVTGGSRGIGAAIVRRLAQEGAVVGVGYAQRADAARALVEQIRAGGGRAEAFGADLRAAAAAARLAASGVTVNALAPALIEDTGDGALAANADELRRLIPVGRFGTPAEVADLALAMLRNGYLTNQTISLDGGIHPH